VREEAALQSIMNLMRLSVYAEKISTGAILPGGLIRIESVATRKRGGTIPVTDGRRVSETHDGGCVRCQD